MKENTRIVVVCTLILAFTLQVYAFTPGTYGKLTITRLYQNQGVSTTQTSSAAVPCKIIDFTNARNAQNANPPITSSAIADALTFSCSVNGNSGSGHLPTGDGTYKAYIRYRQDQRSPSADPNWKWGPSITTDQTGYGSTLLSQVDFNYQLTAGYWEFEVVFPCDYTLWMGEPFVDPLSMTSNDPLNSANPRSYLESVNCWFERYASHDQLSDGISQTKAFPYKEIDTQPAIAQPFGVSRSQSQWTVQVNPGCVSVITGSNPTAYNLSKPANPNLYVIDIDDIDMNTNTTTGLRNDKVTYNGGAYSFGGIYLRINDTLAQGDAPIDFAIDSCPYYH